MNNAEPRKTIIGGVFALEDLQRTNGSALCWLERPSVLLANARSAIGMLVESLRPPRTWVPSFLCEAMVEGIDQTLTALRYFPVGYDLDVRSKDWLADVGRGDLVVLIDYFGFPCDRVVAESARERAAWIVEDASQALFSNGAGVVADYVVFSPRKFLGVPDGGILVCNRPLDLDDISLQKPPMNWWLGALQALVLRRDFDAGGGDRSWFDLFRKAEANVPVGRFAMSDLTEAILRHTVAADQIAQRRRRNYQLLLEALGDVALFSGLPYGVVPLGFPIRHNERDRLQQALFGCRIYPPVHWDVRRFVPREFEESHRLAATIMTLPCDQRYGDEHMSRIASSVRQNLD